MRTRTNICYGTGTEGAVKLLSSYHSAGRVNVVCSDFSRGEKLCEELAHNGYTVAIRRYDEPDDGKKGFAFGIGDERAMMAAAERAKGKFALYPDEVTIDIFSPFCGGYAEFLYFDERFCVEYESMAMECYSGLLSAFAEGLAEYYKNLRSPYEDRALKGLLLSAKNVLIGKASREDFVKESLRLSGALVDILSDRTGEFFISGMSRKMGGALSHRLICAYFLNRLLILFTKWNFRDMLIPTENSAPEEPFTELFRSDLLLDETEISVIARKIKRYVGRPDLSRLLKAMDRGAVPDSLFTEIYERGITEGLYYGGS